jgi:hypothetical protein
MVLCSQDSFKEKIKLLIQNPQTLKLKPLTHDEEEAQWEERMLQLLFNPVAPPRPIDEDGEDSQEMLELFAAPPLLGLIYKLCST